MSTNTISQASAARGLGTGTWRLDPARSSVEFHVRHFYGLMTVKGRFKRDEHLRTDDSFDVANHPHVRFVSESATHQGDTLEVPGRHTWGLPEWLGRRLPHVIDRGEPHVTPPAAKPVGQHA